MLRMSVRGSYLLTFEDNKVHLPVLPLQSSVRGALCCAQQWTARRGNIDIDAAPAMAVEAAA